MQARVVRHPPSRSWNFFPSWGQIKIPPTLVQGLHLAFSMPDLLCLDPYKGMILVNLGVAGLQGWMDGAVE